MKPISHIFFLLILGLSICTSCKRPNESSVCPAYESNGWFDSFNEQSFLDFHNFKGDTVRLYINAINLDEEQVAECDKLSKIDGYCPCESNGKITMTFVDSVKAAIDSNQVVTAFTALGKIEIIGKKQYPNQVHSLGINTSLFVGFFEIEPTFSTNNTYPSDENYQVKLEVGQDDDFIQDIKIPYIQITSEYEAITQGIHAVKLNKEKGITQFITLYTRTNTNNNTSIEQEIWYPVQR